MLDGPDMVVLIKMLGLYSKDKVRHVVVRKAVHQTMIMVWEVAEGEGRKWWI